jgi:hypothetical protein
MGVGRWRHWRSGLEIIGDYAMKKYTAKYFIEKFAAIPDEKWGCGNYEQDGRYCALGHCGEQQLKGTDMSRSLEALLNWDTAKINDGYGGDYRELGSTPKERILNALILVEAGVWEEIV